MDSATFEGVVDTGLTHEVANIYSELNGGVSVTANGMTFAVQSLSFSGGITGNTAHYADTFMYAVSSSTGMVTGQATASILANLSSADHGTLDVAMELTTTPGALNGIAALVLSTMEQNGLGSMMPGNATFNGNSVTYAVGVQDANHSHADLVVTQTAANAVSLHADYHLVV